MKAITYLSHKIIIYLTLCRAQILEYLNELADPCPLLWVVMTEVQLVLSYDLFPDFQKQAYISTAYLKAMYLFAWEFGYIFGFEMSDLNYFN